MIEGDPQELLEQLRPGDYRIRPLGEALVVFATVFLAILLTTFFIYQRAVDAQQQEIRQGLIRTLKVVRTVIDPELHRSFIVREQETSPEYLNELAKLYRVLNSDDQIAYVYTAVQRNEVEQGQEVSRVYFVLDPTPAPEDPNEEDNSVHLMQEYEDVADNPRLLEAFESRDVVVSREPYTDQWGTFFAGFVPLHDAEGEFIGVLSMDIAATDYFERLQPIKRATVRAMVTGFFVAFLTGSMVWFLRNFILVINRRRNIVYEELSRQISLARRREMRRTGEQTALRL